MSDNIQFLINPSEDLYSILGLKMTSTDEEIKRAYKTLTLKHHPDRGGDQERFKQVVHAYEILRDSDKKAYYNRMRKEYLVGSFSGTGSGTAPSGVENFFDNIRNKNLRDFIIDSIFVFQREFDIEIPDNILDNFHESVKMVYGIWGEICSAMTPDTTFVRFGGLVIPRSKTDQYLKNEKFG